MAEAVTAGARRATRIALFVPTLSHGGVERTMLNLCRGLLDSGHAVDFIVGNAKGELSGQVPATARLFDFESRRVLYAFPALVRYLRRARPQALIAAMTHCNVIALLARRCANVQTRVIATEHVPISIMGRRSGRLRVQLMPVFARRILPWADFIVAVSHGVADDLANHLHIARARINVIYNPVLTPEFFHEASLPVRHPWCVPGAPPLILSVGRLTIQKDHSTLLRAFALLRKRRDARLLVLGEGEERGALEELARSLGVSDDVSLPGYEPSPYRFMACADLFVLSSRWEGFGLVLVEALAVGSKVVSTDCQAGPSEVLEGGKLGRLVPVGDPVALAQAMHESLAQPKGDVPLAALKRYERAAVVQRYAELALTHQSSR